MPAQHSEQRHHRADDTTMARHRASTDPVAHQGFDVCLESVLVYLKSSYPRCEPAVGPAGHCLGAHARGWASVDSFLTALRIAKFKGVALDHSDGALGRVLK